MAGYGFSVKFWTLQQNNISGKYLWNFNIQILNFKSSPVVVSEKDVSFLQYYNKDANSDGEYHNLKRMFITSRGETWLPGNKRPDKLREAIKVFEDTLKSQEVLSLVWKHSGLLQV